MRLKRLKILLSFLLVFLFVTSANATILWENNATSALDAGINAGALSMTVTAGHGDRFPAVETPHYFMVTLVDTSGNREIVKVTQRTLTSNTMTIVRAQEGTSALPFEAGDIVELRITKNALDHLSKAADINSSHYVCDASAVDQGATTNVNSLKSLVDTIGGSLDATIEVPHTGTGNTTTYTLSTDLTIPSTISLRVHKGAIITVDSGKTLTLQGPVQAGGYTIFAGDGTKTVSSYPQDQAWWGSTQRTDATSFSAGGSIGYPVPAGTLLPYAGSSAPAGWLLCYGQAVSRTTYAALFAIVSTTYGVGDGATTFNLPDLRGRMIVGLDNMGGAAASRIAAATTLGQAAGTETHAHTGASHTHTGPSHTHTTGDVTLTAAQSGLPAHTHDIYTTDNGTTPKNALLSGQYVGTPVQLDTLGVVGGAANASEAHNHGATGAAGTGATGADGTGATSTVSGVSPYLAVTYIIKY